jgi:hypothetical protein
MKLAFILAFVFLVLLSVNVHASLCDFEYLPSYPSANSSMLLMVPKATTRTRLANMTQPMKISYLVVDGDFNIVDEGALSKFNDCWICEFSGVASNFHGSCGPTPFRKSGEFNITFTARDFNDRIEFSKAIDIRPQALLVGTQVDSSGTVGITVEAPIDTEEVWMSLYNAQTGQPLDDYNRSELRKNELFQGRYSMTITSLQNGVYYASFDFVTTSGNIGGGISKFEITSKSTDLSVRTDSSSYWVGQEVVISGQTKCDKVSATVRLPDGRTESLGQKNVVNNQFSYTFKLLSTYNEGSYAVTASACSISSQSSFSVKRVLQVSPNSLNFIVTNRTTAIRKTVTIQNLGNDSVTLSGSTEGLATYVTLSFDRTTLSSASPQSTLTVTLNPEALSSSLTGRVLIRGNDVATFPVDVSVTFSGSPQDGQKIDINPGYWYTRDCKVGESVKQSFTLQNTGKGELSGFSHSLSSGLDGITTVTLPQSSVPESGSGSVELGITPAARNTAGWVRITATSGGSVTIYVSLECVQGLDTDISTLETDVEDLKGRFSDAGLGQQVITSIFENLDTELTGAKSSMDDGDYEDSYTSYTNAKLRYESLKDFIDNAGSAGPAPDGSWITIVVVIVVLILLAFLGFILYNKFGSKILGGLTAKKEKTEEEEEYEEELY